MWVARDSYGKICMFKTKPYIGIGGKTWTIEMPTGMEVATDMLPLDDCDEFKELTFEKSPKEVVIKLK